MPLLPFAPLERLISPAPDAARVAFLKAQPFAHRGLHDAQRVENSRAAVRAAIVRGHGIELDVQAARSGEAFVFHDAELDRLTPARGLLCEHSAEALAAIPLAGTDEPMPRLEEILKLVGGRVPVLIEIKTRSPRVTPLCLSVRSPRVTPLCLSVRRALEGYNGAAAIMSFNPQVAAWFAEHAPRVVRGLVVSEQDDASRLKGWARRWAAVMHAQPDFLAYDVRDLPSVFATKARARGLPVLTWTVRDAAAEATAFAYADEAIYERPR